ncbi:MAG: exonuclease domain-containing protein [Micrococcaceae bacterium]
MLNFTAIDFETANGFRGSACSIGLVKVHDSKIIDEAHYLIKPPAGYDNFEDINVRIHGIRAANVVGAPNFGELFPEIGGFIGDDVIAAHYARFDSAVMRAALEVNKTASPSFDFMCSVKLARTAYKLPSYSLPVAAEAAGVPLINHHDALEDARASALIVIDVAKRKDATDIHDLMAKTNLSLEFFPEVIPGARRVPIPRPGRSWPVEGMNPAPNLEADPRNPLFGQTIVFTGDLTMEREQAKRKAAAMGASTSNLVTQKTTMLVVGAGFTPNDLQKGRLTAKARTVVKLKKTGKDIKVIPESQFLSLI